MNDPYDLARYVAAQEPVYERVRTELSHGRKTSHWMWFIFPQIAGLVLAQNRSTRSAASPTSTG